MSIPLQLALYGGLIPAAVAAGAAWLWSLVVRRAPGWAPAGAGVAIAAGFVAGNMALGEAAAPWIPRSSRHWLPHLAAAGAGVCLLTARFAAGRGLAWAGWGALAAAAGWKLVPNYAALAPHAARWQVVVALASFGSCLASRRAARDSGWLLPSALTAALLACALLIEHGGGLSLAQLAGAACASTAAAALVAWGRGQPLLPAASAPVPAVLLAGLAAQGYFEGFGVPAVSYGLVLLAPASLAASDLARGRLAPRRLLAFRAGLVGALLAAGLATAFLG